MTNFVTIRKRIDFMLELEAKKEQGYFDNMIKKEGLKLEEKLRRLQKYFRRRPKLDQAARRPLRGGHAQGKNICIAEARKLGITLVSIIDSDCDPGTHRLSYPG